MSVDLYTTGKVLTIYPVTFLFIINHRPVMSLESLRKESPRRRGGRTSPGRFGRRPYNNRNMWRRRRSNSPVRRRRRSRSKTPPEDKFKGSLSEGLALQQESDEEQ